MRHVLLLTLLGACSVEAVVIKEPVDPPSFEAVFSYQPRDRLLLTAVYPEEGVCSGLLLGRDIGDGIPGQLLELPQDWSLELAYRSKDVENCHESFPQLHRIERAYAGTGYVDWEIVAPELPPLYVDWDVRMTFDRYPQFLDVSAEEVFVEIPGTP